MTAIYNEIEPFAASWTENLITAGLVTPGTVDRRSIVELSPEDVKHATQAHFFSGIAVWSAAARAAGWPDNAELWSGSCPCQPFSAAGNGRGLADERHLWPEWFKLIRECRPPVIVGEQVASKAGLGWLDAVQADLEGAGYAFGAADTCAASVGAPHIRQRLYFVAITNGERLERVRVQLQERRSKSGVLEVSGRGAYDELATPSSSQPGHWAIAEWLYCRDGKLRPVEPGTQPLAHGVAGRVGKLRAFGNAIVLPQAKVFLESVIDVVLNKKETV